MTAMPENDLEVFELFHSNTDTKLEIDYLSFAIFAWKKANFIDRFQEVEGRPPSQDEINRWIRHLSQDDFDSMRVEAAEFFHAAAADYMASEIELARREGREESIAQSVHDIRSRINSLGSLRGQLFIALLTAVLVPPILGGFIFCIRQFDSYMPTIGTFLGLSTREVQQAPATSPPLPPQ